VHATDRMTQLYGDDLGSMARGIPVGFVGDPGDFGQVVAFLCSEHARFVTGVHLPVDGGAIAGLL
jgi:3-oxoacyl-[acyl-carrier protein] reductase